MANGIVTNLFDRFQPRTGRIQGDNGESVAFQEGVLRDVTFSQLVRDETRVTFEAVTIDSILHATIVTPETAKGLEAAAIQVAAATDDSHGMAVGTIGSLFDKFRMGSINGDDGHVVSFREIVLKGITFPELVRDQTRVAYEALLLNGVLDATTVMPEQAAQAVALAKAQETARGRKEGVVVAIIGDGGIIDSACGALVRFSKDVVQPIEAFEGIQDKSVQYTCQIGAVPGTRVATKVELISSQT